MNFFSDWAKKISEGDLLSEEVGHPLHEWHYKIAEKVFENQEGSSLEATKQEGLNKEEAKKLWDTHYGQKKWHQAPAYPYLLAVFYHFFEQPVKALFYAQAFLGILTVFLTFLIAKEIFSHKIAGLSVCLYSLCAVPVFYEGVMLRASLVVFTATLLTWLCTKLTSPMAKGSDFLIYFASTLALGILLKPTLGIFLLPGFVLLPLKRSLTLCSLVLLILSPAFIRNAAVQAPLFSLSSVGPITFISSNTAGYDPTSGFQPKRLSVVEAFEDSKPSLLSAAKASLRTFDKPSEYLALLGKKALSSVSWREEPNNTNFYIFGRRLPALKLLPISFSMLLAPGLIGLIIATRRLKKTWPLYLALGFGVAPLMIFYTISRFRVVLFPVLAIGSAYFLHWLWLSYLEGRWRQLLISILALSAMFYLGSPSAQSFASPKRVTKNQSIRTNDYVILYETLIKPGIEKASADGDLAGQKKLFEEYLKYLPPEIQAGELPSANEKPNSILYFSLFFRDYSQWLFDSGDKKRSVQLRIYANSLYKIWEDN